MKPFAFACVLTLAAWLAVGALSARVGAVPGSEWDLVKEIRLPRFVLASAVGSGLAVAGAVLQAVFCNPLADPYALGISSAAALGAAIAGALGWELGLSGFAGGGLLGAAIATALLVGLSLRRGNGGELVLLLGVILGFLGSALLALWFSLADPAGAQAAMGWLFGDLGRARPESASACAITVSALTALAWVRSRELDAFQLGEEDAASLGIDTRRARAWSVGVAATLVGVTVASAGMIGFVGLVVPHLARRFSGVSHSRLIPASALVGALVLSAADWVARVAARPAELPAGVVTALIGAPVFGWLLLRRGR